LQSAAAQKKTEQFDANDLAVVSAPAAAAAPASSTSAKAEPPPFDPAKLVLHPIKEFDWDGHWPNLASVLPLRGVAQQLAQQSELIKCDNSNGVMQFHLRVAVETLLSAGSVDKLATALTEHFGKTIRVMTEIGAVQQTANAQAVAQREALQRETEETLRNDPFVQTLIREFGAMIVPDSIKPI
jgi:DNA polymerase-3 subunit gamma/tau